jgi:hypothetical protein
MDRRNPVRKIPQDSWFCFLEQEPLETGSQEKVKGGTLSAGNDLTRPLYSGQEKAERPSAMTVPKRIPVRTEKAAGPARFIGQEIVRKLLATTEEMQRPVRRNSGNARKFSKEQEPLRLIRKMMPER